MGVIEARRRILLSAPHPVTTTPAPIATFNTDMVGKLRSAKFGFLPMQSGSGDPSPTNVRPISGWDGLTIYHSGSDTSNPTSYPVSWQSAGTIYGGYVDAVRGEVVATHKGIIFTGDEQFRSWMPCDGGNWFIYDIANPDGQTVNYALDKCSHFMPMNPNLMLQTTPTGRLGKAYNYAAFSTPFDTASDFKTWLTGQYNNGTPVTIVYPLDASATKPSYALTPQIIKSLKGANNLWSNANGDTTITYWTH